MGRHERPDSLPNRGGGVLYPYIRLQQKRRPDPKVNGGRLSAGRARPEDVSRTSDVNWHHGHMLAQRQDGRTGMEGQKLACLRARTFWEDEKRPLVPQELLRVGERVRAAFSLDRKRVVSQGEPSLLERRSVEAISRSHDRSSVVQWRRQNGEDDDRIEVAAMVRDDEGGAS